MIFLQFATVYERLKQTKTKQPQRSRAITKPFTHKGREGPQRKFNTLTTKENTKDTKERHETL
jgi:hypothetical protein